MFQVGWNYQPVTLYITQKKGGGHFAVAMRLMFLFDIGMANQPAAPNVPPSEIRVQQGILKETND